jgi:nitroreductase
MELLDTIRARRSVKHYDSNHRLSESELRHLMSYSVLAPSSFNMQNWHFVVVTDRAVQEQICAAGWNQAQLRDASATIVLAGNIKGWQNTDRYLRKAPEEVQKMFGGMVPGLYDGKEAFQREEAVRSVGLVGMNMMLVAKDMGYDTCPMIGYDAAKVAEIVGLPEEVPPLMIITVGKAMEAARPRMGLLDLQEVVSIDKFGNNTLTGEVDDS